MIKTLTKIDIKKDDVVIDPIEIATEIYVYSLCQARERVSIVVPDDNE